ncbi:hypothetical protein [Flavobacterium sp. WC2429]|uniref:Lipoprotein n=2 Tax=unclassified Flavobacterium TaxID=196869 RepID=A0AB39WFA9_9FLAO
MKNLITLLICTFFFISCGNSNQGNQNNAENIIKVKTIIGKTEKEIEKILGKPDSSEKVSPSNTPCKDEPCTKMFYQKNKFEIVYINGKSDWITINNISDFDCNSENIVLLGLPPTIPDFENLNGFRWSNIENISEINFSNNGEDKIDYIYIKSTTK